MKNTFTSWDEC